MIPGGGMGKEVGGYIRMAIRAVAGAVLSGQADEDAVAAVFPGGGVINQIMAGGTDLGNMNTGNHVFIAMEMTSRTSGIGIHMAGMIQGVGVRGEVCRDTAVAIVTSTGFADGTRSGGPLGAWEGRNQSRRPWIMAVAAMKFMGIGDNIGGIVTIHTTGSCTGYKEVMIRVGRFETEQGFMTSGTFTLVMGTDCYSNPIGVIGICRVGLQAVVIIIFGGGVTDLADALGRQTGAIGQPADLTGGISYIGVEELDIHADFVVVGI